MTLLRGDVQSEIEQTARRGSAEQCLELVEGAAQAYDDDDFAFAYEAGERAKALAPRSATVRLIVGDAAYRLGRWRDAQRELGAYKRMSNRRDRDHVLADVERALGRPEKALEILDGMRSSDVGDDLVVEGMIVAAGALHDLSRTDEAIALLRRGPTRPSTVLGYHLRLWYALADLLEQAGHRAEARELWDVIYAEDPEFFDVADRRL